MTAVETPTDAAPVRLTARVIICELAVLWTCVGLVAFVVIDLTNLRTPFTYSGDNLFVARIIKEIIETGSLQTSGRLGVPFGQDLHDYPLGGNNGTFLLLRFLATFVHDWALLINLYYLATFFMAASAAWVASRLLGTGRVLAIAVALVFAFAPFHFSRLPHLLLANYWSVPIGVLIAVRAAQGRVFVDPRSRSGVLTDVLVVVGCVVVGSFGSYYAVFSVMTVAMLCAATALAHRTIRPLLHGLAVSALMAAVLIANVWTSISYAKVHGSNPVASARAPAELDRYGLRLTELLRVGRDTHFGFLRTLSAHLPANSDGKIEADTLGVLGVVALVCMVVWIGTSLVRRRMPTTVEGLLAFATLCWILIAVPGGLSGVLWGAGFHSMRAWNRVSILILFLLLLWLALVCRPLLATVRQRRHGNKLAALGIAVATVVALLAQTPSRVEVRQASMRSYYADSRQFAALERALEPRASVLQLPIRRFPESAPRGKSRDYAMLIPYLHTTSLRFSYAGMKGRESEWQAAIDPLSGGPLVRAASAAGFDAVLIDRNGYADHGRAVARSLRAALGTPPMRGSGRHWVAFNLTDYRRTHRPSQRLKTDLFATPRLNPGTCFPWDELPDSMTTSFWCPAHGTFLAVTPRPEAKSTLNLQLEAPAGSGSVRLRWLGRVRDVKVGVQPVHLTIHVGRSKRLEIAIDSRVPEFTSSYGKSTEDPRHLFVRVDSTPPRQR